MLVPEEKIRVYSLYGRYTNQIPCAWTARCEAGHPTYLAHSGLTTLSCDSIAKKHHMTRQEARGRPLASRPPRRGAALSRPGEALDDASSGPGSRGLHRLVLRAINCDSCGGQINISLSGGRRRARHQACVERGFVLVRARGIFYSEVMLFLRCESSSFLESLFEGAGHVEGLLDVVVALSGEER